MKKQLFIIGLAAILLLGGGAWLLKRSAPSEQSGENEEASLVNNVENDSDKVVIYFFWGDGCPHCAVEKPFLEEMENKYPELRVESFETWKNQDNAQLFQKVAQAYGIQARGVPTTFIGDFEPIVGYAEYMADDIEAKIVECIENGCVNPGDKLLE